MTGMPIYEYRCGACRRKVSIFWRSLSAVDDAKAECTFCGSRGLTRLVSRVRVIRGGSHADAAPEGDDDVLREMENVDENDPRALGRFMRKLASESGEDMPPEFSEVISRLEKGESPEAIEQQMGDLLGSEDGPPGMMDDDYGAPPPDPTAEADKKAEAEDRKKVEKKRTLAMKGKPRRSSTRRASKPRTRAKPKA